ncbi:hypothetical protein NDU88_009987 [Pleurodeles waltl]|uniref:Uncharacterized protein n=1 Tax=Pleurodeles waltl TaxID=8319 RepID=A0AAV7RXU7_PLEWA|nr:hypothetical protein NDU88_009987 [Pleurodeles waltl]
MVVKAAAVREALRVLCEAESKDLIQPDILLQAWVGLDRPMLAVEGGVAAAILACSLPQQMDRSVGTESGSEEEATRKKVAEPEAKLASKPKGKESDKDKTVGHKVEKAEKRKQRAEQKD